MNPINVARRVSLNSLVKVVLRCKVVIVVILARAGIVLSQFRGLSDWLGRKLVSLFNYWEVD